MFVDIDRVKHVYSGRDGACCCGCAGKHTWNEEFARAAEMVTGHRPEYISDRVVKSVIKKIQNSADPNADFDYGTCVGTVVGARVYIAYYDH